MRYNSTTHRRCWAALTVQSPKFVSAQQKVLLTFMPLHSSCQDFRDVVATCALYLCFQGKELDRTRLVTRVKGKEASSNRPPLR